MKSAPAFQFYPTDFVGSATVGVSTTEEIGIYTLLLCKDWMETGFVFDEARLAIWCKVSVRTFRKAWAHLAPKFPAREVAGVPRHFNPRLEAERAKQAEFRAVQSAKGIASGQSRRNRGLTGVEPVLNPSRTGWGTGTEPNGNSPSLSLAPANAVARTRAGNGNRASHSIGTQAPGSGSAFCAECGDGVLEEVADQRRPVRCHAVTCSQRPFVALAAREG